MMRLGVGVGVGVGVGHVSIILEGFQSPEFSNLRVIWPNNNIMISGKFQIELHSGQLCFAGLCMLLFRRLFTLLSLPFNHSIILELTLRHLILLTIKFSHSNSCLRL